MTSVIFLSAILALVVYLTLTKRDETPSERIEREERERLEYEPPGIEAPAPKTA